MISFLQISGVALLLGSSTAEAQRVLYSTNSIQPCMNNSAITADRFHATLNADNNTLTYDWSGTNSYSGNATISISITDYDLDGNLFATESILCASTYAAFCPSTPGQVELSTVIEVPEGYLDIPEEIFTTAEPAAYLQLMLNNAADMEQVGCFQVNMTGDASQASPAFTAMASNHITSTTDGNSTGTSEGMTTTSSPTNGSGRANSDSSASTTYLSWSLLL